MNLLATMATALFITGVTPSLAASCSAITPTSVASELNAHQASTKLLKKAHIKSLAAYGLFYRCKGQTSKGQTYVITFSRFVGDEERHTEYVTITFYRFATLEARDLRVRNDGWPDSAASKNPDIDVLYFLPPDGVEAIKIERVIGYGID